MKYSAPTFKKVRHGAPPIASNFSPPPVETGKQPGQPSGGKDGEWTMSSSDLLRRGHKDPLDSPEPVGSETVAAQQAVSGPLAPVTKSNIACNWEPHAKRKLECHPKAAAKGL